MGRELQTGRCIMSAVDSVDSSDWVSVVVLESRDVGQQYLELLTDYGIDAELGSHQAVVDENEDAPPLPDITDGFALLVSPESLEEAMDLIQERDDLDDVVTTRPDNEPFEEDDEDESQAKKSFGMNETTEEELFFPEDDTEEDGVLTPSVIDEAFDVDLGDAFEEFGESMDDDLEDYPL